MSTGRALRRVPEPPAGLTCAQFDAAPQFAEG
jgi:hypothetical protein